MHALSYMRLYKAAFAFTVPLGLETVLYDHVILHTLFYLFFLFSSWFDESLWVVVCLLEEFSDNTFFLGVILIIYIIGRLSELKEGRTFIFLAETCTPRQRILTWMESKVKKSNGRFNSYPPERGSRGSSHMWKH